MQLVGFSSLRRSGYAATMTTTGLGRRLRFFPPPSFVTSPSKE
jgi:hypothetical protein